MIIEGLKLALLGMTVVFVFLVLLVLIVNLSSWLLKPYTQKEQDAVSSRTDRLKHSKIDEQRLAAVISAAIAAHRARFNKRIC